MRILIVTDAWSPQVNGVVRTLNAVIAELEAKGHDVRLINPAGPPLLAHAALSRDLADPNERRGHAGRDRGHRP